MDPKRGIFLPPFDEMAHPRLLAELAADAEEAGWDGFFLWDHMRYRAPTRAVLDPWVSLAAIASATERIRIGPMVTPLSRRRPHKVARETATLDHLSDGRLVLGVGLGSERNGELGPFGEEEDPKRRAALLDDGLDKLAGYWAGEFEPVPVQEPRIPVWVASRWPKRKPLRRAARWDGLFPIELPEPDALRELAAEVRGLRADPDEPFDLVAEVDPGGDPVPWAEAGATWVVDQFGQTPRESEVRAVIAAGP
ncbi:MAG: LLM class flavin-dependent oxidoreductase [Actinomycetota bacterium]|nr:LLM class flavin-dependent oxidoreductase [Actinomycetota bacterium]